MAPLTAKVHVDLSELHEAVRLVEVLRPQPGDVIVLHVEMDISEEEMATIERNWEAIGLPNRCVVLSGVDVMVVRPDDLP